MTAVTAGAAVLRLGWLGHQWLWRDEAFTAMVVRMPFGQMLTAVRADSAPPLAYILDRAGAAIWAGPAGLRLVSALAGIAMVPLCAALARRIGGDRAGRATAAFCALAPALVLSARDARMYALASTLVVASTLLLWRAVDRPSPVRWLLYAAVLAAALYTDYFALLAVPVQLLGVAVVLRPRWRVVAWQIGAQAVAVVALLPWLVAARDQLSHAATPFWVPASTPATVGGEAVQLFTGQPLDPWVPGAVWLQVLQGIAVAAGVVMCAALVWRRRSLANPRGAAFVAVCGGGAVVLLLLISLYRPVFDGRYASTVWGPLFAIAGTGLAAIGSARRLQGALLASTAAAALALAVVQTHPDTPAAAAQLEARAPRPQLVDAHPSEYELLLYYGDGPLRDATRVVQPSVPWYWGTAAYPPGAVLPAVPPDDTTLYYVAEPSDPPAALLPPSFHRAWQRCWIGVCVTAYRR